MLTHAEGNVRVITFLILVQNTPSILGGSNPWAAGGAFDLRMPKVLAKRWLLLLSVLDECARLTGQGSCLFAVVEFWNAFTPRTNPNTRHE